LKRKPGVFSGAPLFIGPTFHVEEEILLFLPISLPVHYLKCSIHVFVHQSKQDQRYSSLSHKVVEGKKRRKKTKSCIDCSVFYEKWDTQRLESLPTLRILPPL